MMLDPRADRSAAQIMAFLKQALTLADEAQFMVVAIRVSEAMEALGTEYDGRA